MAIAKQAVERIFILINVFLTRENKSHFLFVHDSDKK